MSQRFFVQILDGVVRSVIYSLNFTFFLRFYIFTLFGMIVPKNILFKLLKVAKFWYANVYFRLTFYCYYCCMFIYRCQIPILWRVTLYLFWTLRIISVRFWSIWALWLSYCSMFFICDSCCVLCEKFADYLLLCSLCKILIAAQSSASKTIRVVIV